MKKIGTFGSMPKSIDILKTTVCAHIDPQSISKREKGALMMLYGPFASFISGECLIQVGSALNARLKYGSFGLHRVR